VASFSDQLHEHRATPFTEIEEDAGKRAFLLRLLAKPALAGPGRDRVIGRLLGQPAGDLVDETGRRDRRDVRTLLSLGTVCTRIDDRSIVGPGTALRGRRRWHR
jgi:hypothetical protein